MKTIGWLLCVASASQLLCRTRGEECIDERLDCGNGTVSKYQCDGQGDCAGGEDEVDPPVPPCSEDRYLCSPSKQCLPPELLCDAVENCPDGSDEKDCNHCAGFLCDDGRCIKGDWQCDGDEDCAQGEDENECAVPECSEVEYLCRPKSRCLPNEGICDFLADCPDGSDETNCEIRPCAGFKCDNFMCVAREWRCDGDDDCGDGSDETGCPSAECPDEVPYCETSNRCLDRYDICDAVRDCPDGSDERDCETYACEGFKCPDNRCIRSEWVCDGSQDCVGGADEQDCQ